MSFAVFGATMDHCRKMAAKKISHFTFKDGVSQPKTEREWQQEVEDKALAMFNRYDAGKGVLPKLSADVCQPCICQQFIELCSALQATRLTIMQKQPVLNDNGQPKLNKKRQPIMRYQPYKGGC